MLRRRESSPSSKMRNDQGMETVLKKKKKKSPRHCRSSRHGSEPFLHPHEWKILISWKRYRLKQLQQQLSNASAATPTLPRRNQSPQSFSWTTPLLFPLLQQPQRLQEWLTRENLFHSIGLQQVLSWWRRMWERPSLCRRWTNPASLPLFVPATHHGSRENPAQSMDRHAVVNDSPFQREDQSIPDRQEIVEPHLRPSKKNKTHNKLGFLSILLCRRRHTRLLQERQGRSARALVLVAALLVVVAVAALGVSVGQKMAATFPCAGGIAVDESASWFLPRKSTPQSSMATTLVLLTLVSFPAYSTRRVLGLLVASSSSSSSWTRSLARPQILPSASRTLAESLSPSTTGPKQPRDDVLEWWLWGAGILVVTVGWCGCCWWRRRRRRSQQTTRNTTTRTTASTTPTTTSLGQEPWLRASTCQNVDSEAEEEMYRVELQKTEEDSSADEEDSGADDKEMASSSLSLYSLADDDTVKMGNPSPEKSHFRGADELSSSSWHAVPRGLIIVTTAG